VSITILKQDYKKRRHITSFSHSRRFPCLVWAHRPHNSSSRLGSWFSGTDDPEKRSQYQTVSKNCFDSRYTENGPPEHFCWEDDSLSQKKALLRQIEDLSLQEGWRRVTHLCRENYSPQPGGLLVFVRRMTSLCHEDYSTLPWEWLAFVRNITRFCQEDYSPLSRWLLAFARRINRLCQEDNSPLLRGLLAFVRRITRIC